MIGREIPKYCLQSIKNKEIEKGQCVYSHSKKYEFNINHGKVTLLRTTIDDDIKITIIDNNKKGSLSLNKTDKESLDEAINNVMEICNASEIDEANDIAIAQPAEEFISGDKTPDLDRMYELINNFALQVQNEFPKIKLGEAFFDFTRYTQYFMNTNGVDFTTSNGVYNLMLDFTAKDSEKTTSFNYTMCSFKELEKELMDLGSCKALLKQSVEELNAAQINDKFVGDVIITPDCLGEMLYYYTSTFIGDGPIISGTSRLGDKLNEKVSSDKLTIHSCPTSDKIASGYYVTPDGFKAEDCYVINKGVLSSLLLSQYGANKTNNDRSKNTGGIYIVDPGDKSLEEMINNTNKGILLARFSGGYPSANGDFSGVAKNSFYIQNGEIKHAITETMISGNLYDMFNDIVSISKETIDFGNSILPWVKVNNITISGK